MKTKIIVGSILLAALLLGVVLIDRGTFTSRGNSSKEPANDPIDVSLELVNAWLDTVTATSSASLSEFLATRSDVSEALATTLLARDAAGSEVDVLFCQLNTPKRVGAKSVFKTEDAAQVMIVSRGGEKTPNQSIVTLALRDDVWVITDLSCSAGEVGGPVGEYSFEQAGQLIQASIPSPYDANFWHIVFERDAVNGHVARLLFDGESMCNSSGQEAVCEPATFVETTTVSVQADMTEEGALVRRMELR